MIEKQEKVTRGEFLRLAGISPNTLHNWVARGLLPAFCSYYFQGGGGSAFYYPAWAVERASDIKRLRDEGYSMQKIRKILTPLEEVAKNVTQSG